MDKSVHFTGINNPGSGAIETIDNGRQSTPFVWVHKKYMSRDETRPPGRTYTYVRTLIGRMVIFCGVRAEI